MAKPFSFLSINIFFLNSIKDLYKFFKKETIININPKDIRNFIASTDLSTCKSFGIEQKLCEIKSNKDNSAPTKNNALKINLPEKIITIAVTNKADNNKNPYEIEAKLVLKI